MGRPKKKPNPIRYWEGERRPQYTPQDQDDADAFRQALRDRKRFGPRAPSVRESQQTLIEFVESEWWPKYGSRQGVGTRRRYEEIWRAHLYDRIGSEPLAHIDRARVIELRDEMEKSDRKPREPRKGASAVERVAAAQPQKIGAPTIDKTLDVLSSILDWACNTRGLMPNDVNPVRGVKRPSQPARKPIRPLAPLTVEVIREQMMLGWQSRKRGVGRSAEWLAWYRMRNAVMVSLLAYAGLRPSEMCRALWDDIVGERLHVVETKRGRVKLKEVDLLAPVTRDLAEWRLRCGRPAGTELIIPSSDGDGWVKHDWDNWRNRVYQPAAEAAGVRKDDRDPYHLRHSFVSLLLWAGEDPSYVAEQAGHSLRTQQDHYAGFMRELRGKPRVPAAEAIRLAREERSEALKRPSFGT